MKNTMTPEQEARYALDYGGERSSLSMAAQLAYDRLVAEGGARTLTAPVDPRDGITTRTSPEVRERILAMFKAANSKYAKPFDKDRLAVASLIGTESWSEYGQVVLQMAILDTLLSIEEKLERMSEKGDGDQPAP